MTQGIDEVFTKFLDNLFSFEIKKIFRQIIYSNKIQSNTIGRNSRRLIRFYQQFHGLLVSPTKRMPQSHGSSNAISSSYFTYSCIRSIHFLVDPISSSVFRISVLLRGDKHNAGHIMFWGSC